MAAFDDVTKERVRYHMRYPQITSGVLIAAGVLYAGTSQSIIENMMNHVNELTIPRVVRILDILDSIEQQIVDANERLQVDKADVVTLNRIEHSQLESTYIRWQGKLSEILSVPVNPNTPNAASGMSGLNCRVQG